MTVQPKKKDFEDFARTVEQFTEDLVAILQSGREAILAHPSATTQEQKDRFRAKVCASLRAMESLLEWYEAAAEAAEYEGDAADGIRIRDAVVRAAATIAMYPG